LPDSVIAAVSPIAAAAMTGFRFTEMKDDAMQE
jgi:hypothetical protein